MRRLFVIVIAAVLLISAMNFITVEVKPIDPHEGAVAFAMPKVSASFLQGATMNSAPTLPTGASVTLLVEPHPYVGPAPTKKSLLQILLPTGCISFNCQFEDELGGSEGGAGCTILSTETKSVSILTYAKLSIVGAGGAAYDYQTETVTTASTQTINHLSCSAVSEPNTGWKFSGTPTYDVGTFYFTNGWGTYAFTAEVWMVVAGSPDVKLGATQLAVMPA